MKRVMIVGFCWPYITGSKRVISLAQNLGRYDWSPIVLTAPFQVEPNVDFEIIKTNYEGFLGRWIEVAGLKGNSDIGNQLKDNVSHMSPFRKKVLRKAFHLVKEVLAYPDEHKKWVKHAIESASKVIEQRGVDAIVSVWPVASHVVARKLKEQYGLPWLADFADLWSDNSAYPYGRLRKIVDQKLELETLQYADALTTSSEPLAVRMAKFHGGRSVLPIMLGYNREIINEPRSKLTEDFTITYTGMFYEGKRDPEQFLKALSELLNEDALDRSRVAVRFYGPHDEWVKTKIEHYGLGDVVIMKNEVSLSECLERQRESHVLLQVNWGDVNERGVFSGKFLDYLAARRPILAAGGAGVDDVVSGILKESGSGVYAVSVEEIKKALVSFYDEYSHEGAPTYNGNSDSVDKYSNVEMAKEFAKILENIT